MKRLALVVALCSSCSFAFVEKLPPNYPKDAPPDCTSSQGFVAWDALIAISSGIAAGFIYDTAVDQEDQQLANLSYASGVSAGMHLLSAIYGQTHTSRCRKAKKSFLEDPTKSNIIPNRP